MSPPSDDHDEFMAWADAEVKKICVFVKEQRESNAREHAEMGKLVRQLCGVTGLDYEQVKRRASETECEIPKIPVSTTPPATDDFDEYMAWVNAEIESTNNFRKEVKEFTARYRADMDKIFRQLCGVTGLDYEKIVSPVRTEKGRSGEENQGATRRRTYAEVARGSVEPADSRQRRSRMRSGFRTYAEAVKFSM